MASFSSNRRLFVLGGDGAIGSSLTAYLTAEREQVFSTTRRPGLCNGARPFLDMTSDDFTELMALAPQAGDVAFFVAANARVAACEADPKGAFAVNVEGVLRLAGRLARAGAQVILLSTNQVLPDDRPLVAAETPPSPRSEYGRQKAMAEAGVLALGGAVLRLSKVFGPSDPLLRGWRESLKAGAAIMPFSDMTAAPISENLVARTLHALSRNAVQGIFQLSAERDVTYAELAAAFALRLGASPDLVRPKSWREAGLGVAPAQYSSMDGAPLLALTGIRQPDPFTVINEI